MSSEERDVNLTKLPPEPPRTRRYAYLISLGCVTVFAAAIIATGWGLHGRAFAEKIVTRIAMPSGLLGFGLIGITVLAFLRGGKAVGSVCAFVTIAFWLLGAPVVSERLIGVLEERYQVVDPSAIEPLDAIVVLGGSTRSDEQGRVWLSPFGDRVMLAARIYQLGHTSKLIATGTDHAWRTDNALGPGAAMIRMWSELGIPDDAIVQVDGRNTSEEMQNLKELLGRTQAKRVGLLTSAFHLPRAERLARRHGLDLIPIAADFQIGDAEPLPQGALPTAQGFRESELAMKELLAYLVDR